MKPIFGNISNSFKADFGQFARFFSSLPGNLKNCELTNAQIRFVLALAIIPAAFALAGLQWVVTPVFSIAGLGYWISFQEWASFSVFLGAYFTTIAPELGGYGFQKSNTNSLKKTFMAAGEAMAANMAAAQAQAKAAALASRKAKDPNRPITNTQRQRDAKAQKPRSKRRRK